MMLTTTQFTGRCRSIARGNGSSLFFSAFSVLRQRSQEPKHAKFDALVPAVREYYDTFGHFVIPRTYKIQWTTTNDDGLKQETTWTPGRTLEAFLSNPRHRKTYPHVIDALDTMGFPVHVDYTKFLWEEYYLKALRCYKQLHGDLCVKKVFTVPSNASEWPSVCWKMNLGYFVVNSRALRATFPAWKIESLNAIGFIWDVADYRWHQRILPALRHFHHLHGHTIVSKSFVVPSNDPTWPNELLWGLHLGIAVDGIRWDGRYAKQIVDYADELAQLGFVLGNVSDFRWSERILPSLHVFYQLHGHTKVPILFVVPSSAPWPAKAYGLKLGCILDDIKRQNNYAPQRQRDQKQLEAMGFMME